MSSTKAITNESLKITSIQAQQTWALRHQVMWPNQPIDYVKLDHDEDGLHFGLWKNNHLIAVISLFIENNQAQFRKFATKVDEQGKGYGSILLTHLIEQAKLLQVERIWCNARADKTTFYKRFGMVETPQLFSKGGIDYIIMESLHSL